ncbi:MAG: energy transducer TonB [Bryobacteraceae bacterium]|jgi:TonB family protein
MSHHLSSQQISGCLIGAGEPSEQRHARECAACRAEIETLATPLAWFRASVHNWSDQAMTNSFEPAPVLLLTPESLDPTCGAYSLLIHCAAIALLFALGTVKPVRMFVRETATLIAPDLKPYLAEKKTMQGGGGGGTRSPLDASRGKLPKIAPRQFTPPRVDPPENPKLPMMPTIVAPPDVPNLQANNYGDPLSRMGVPSSGIGLGGGIGTGAGGGVGPGKGPGFGPGAGGGFGGGAYRIGGGVSPPAVLHKVEPEYSEEARKAKWQGTVVLELVVDANGHPRDLRVMRALGLGLDQKAIEAVEKWTFKPGMKDGKPVPVIATIEVNFRLL